MSTLEGLLWQGDRHAPLGMADTVLWEPPDEVHRLPAAYRPTGFGETEPAAGGFHAVDQPGAE